MTKGANWGFLFFDHFFRGWPELVRSVDFEDMPGFLSKLKRLRFAIPFLASELLLIVSISTNNVKNTQNGAIDIVKRAVIKKTLFGV